MTWGLWGLDSTVAARTAMPQMYRGLGLRKGDFPPDLVERIERHLGGEPDNDLHNDLLNHLDREGEGLGTWWSRDKDVASEYVQDGFGTRDYDYEVMLGADWDGRGGYSPLTNEDKALEDDDVNAAIRRNHEMQIGDIGLRPRGGDWATVPGKSGRWASRTAMPAPMPQGITFHYHGDGSRIPNEPGFEVPMFGAPAVEARRGGEWKLLLGWWWWW